MIKETRAILMWRDGWESPACQLRDLFDITAFHKSSGITMVDTLKIRRPLFRARMGICVDIIDVSRGVDKPWWKKTSPSVDEAPNVPLMPMVDVAKKKMENPTSVDTMRDPNNPIQESR